MKRFMVIAGLICCVFVVFISLGERDIQSSQKIKIHPINTFEDEKSIFPLVKTEKQKPIQLLIIGSDKHQEDIARADVMMIANYDPNSTKMKIVSIMRDTYVDIPGYGKSKINHAYTWGGEELLKQTIHNNFNISVTHTAVFDFGGFVNIMNVLFPTGVSVELSKGMIDHWKWAKQEGKQVIKGEEILQYVRFRGDINNDFGRVERQQEIIQLAEESLMNQIQSGEGIATVVTLIRESIKNVDTSTSIDEVIKYGTILMLNPIEKVDTLRIPIQGSYSNLSTMKSGLVLEIDERKNKKAIEAFFGNND
ncbi:LCP family protein [Rossellomorea aquimaris]|uniref:LCP family protein n=1 Tax=Rossellomorea aquimaris TaxID=189382 RepID=UPI0007D09790|nr:LCP family protein [Rossellomorea aquimaris]